MIVATRSPCSGIDAGQEAIRAREARQRALLIAGKKQPRRERARSRLSVVAWAAVLTRSTRGHAEAERRAPVAGGVRSPGRARPRRAGASVLKLCCGIVVGEEATLLDLEGEEMFATRASAEAGRPFLDRYVAHAREEPVSCCRKARDGQTLARRDLLDAVERETCRLLRNGGCETTPPNQGCDCEAGAVRTRLCRRASAAGTRSVGPAGQKCSSNLNGDDGGTALGDRADDGGGWARPAQAVASGRGTRADEHV